MTLRNTKFILCDPSCLRAFVVAKYNRMAFIKITMTEYQSIFSSLGSQPWIQDARAVIITIYYDKVYQI